MRRIAIAAAVALTCTWALAAESQKKDVDIQAADGTNLKGSYFTPGRPGPAILLLHQCNMDRHAWDGLAQDLADAGFHVLTFDFRGFGDSGGKSTDAAERRKVMQEKWPGDVDTAYAYLLQQKGVDQARVVAGGASCGVTQSSDLAARRHEIHTLMLLSGQASAATKEYLTATPEWRCSARRARGTRALPRGLRRRWARPRIRIRRSRFTTGPNTGCRCLPSMRSWSR
ncbi:MAG: alpha/beta hydrolase [Acidobacteriia bacterium]|nr:alpha/beta hydrolase [Terriglobia bacterium]